MSQISPPIRILLVCAIAFMAAWMLFLKPKDELAAEPASTPNVASSEPAVSEPGKIAEAAQGAVDASDAQLQAQQSVDGVDAGESAAAAGVTPGAAASGSAGAPAAATDLKGVPKPVARAIRKEKAVVLLFWNRKSADDRAVRSALRDVNRWDGRVHVRAAPLAHVSRYSRITRGADVVQSPTVVVVDPSLRAETLVGYVDTQAIDQAVLDGLRNTTGMFTSSYLREINDVCARFADSAFAMPEPDNGRQFAATVGGVRSRLARFSREFRAVKAPRRFAALRTAAVRDHRAYAALYAELAAFIGRNPSTARVVAADGRFSGRERTITKRYNRRMDAQNVLACGKQS